MARPARSPGLGGATRSKVIGSEIGGAGTSTTGAAVAVPVPTWQAATGVLVCRQAPPSIEAFASRPAGRLSVRSFGESLPLGANFKSIPRFTVDPAAVPPL